MVPPEHKARKIRVMGGKRASSTLPSRCEKKVTEYERICVSHSARVIVGKYNAKDVRGQEQSALLTLLLVVLQLAFMVKQSSCEAFSISLPSRVWRELRKDARESDRSMSRIVLRALEKYDRRYAVALRQQGRDGKGKG